jgi:hypothetical protein
MTTMSNDHKRIGTLADRKNLERWLVVGLVFFNLILMCVAIFVGAQLLRTVAEVEKTDRVSARATAYRLCSRNSVDRAFAHSRVMMAGGLRALAPLEDEHGIPILDCTPNLDGRGAVPLPIHAQRDFVRRWERHELTNSELGICPGSHIPAQTRVNEC